MKKKSEKLVYWGDMKAKAADNGRILRVHDMARIRFEEAQCNVLRKYVIEKNRGFLDLKHYKLETKEAAREMYEEVGKWALSMLKLPPNSIYMSMAIYTVYGFTYHDVYNHLVKEVSRNSSRASRKVSDRILSAFRKHDRENGLDDRIPIDPELLEDMEPYIKNWNK